MGVGSEHNGVARRSHLDSQPTTTTTTTTAFVSSSSSPLPLSTLPSPPPSIETCKIAASDQWLIASQCSIDSVDNDCCFTTATTAPDASTEEFHASPHRIPFACFRLRSSPVTPAAQVGSRSRPRRTTLPLTKYL